MEKLPVNDAFAEYVQSMTDLDALENMTRTLDRELMDSQRMMTEIRSVFDSFSQVAEPVDNSLRHEDLSKFLEADVPNLLLPGMAQTTLEVDLDHILTTMKGYAEDLNKNIVPQPKNREHLDEMKSLDLDQYASSLDLLGKRLANMKLSKKDEVCIRNPDLEGKLSQLCEDVNMFTKVSPHFKSHVLIAVIQRYCLNRTYFLQNEYIGIDLQ